MLFFFALKSDGTLNIEYVDDSGSQKILTGDGPVSVDIWHHVAFVFDAEVGSVRLYVNGEESAASSTDASSMHQASAGQLQLGTSDTGYAFNGGIAGVAVSTSALYNSTFSPAWPMEVASTTQGAWILNGSEGATDVLDASGNGHTGTVVDATWVPGCP
jgi:hypothetical protein